MVAPSHLTAASGDKQATVRWQTNQPENRVISGYNIYQSTEDARFEKVTSTPYPGDLDAGFAEESYLAAGLENGASYRFTVSTVYPGGREAFAPDTVEVVPRPEGTIRLLQSFKGNESGFCFARQSSVPTDDLNNDIYLTTIKGQLHLASPNRIDVVLRKSGFLRLSEEQLPNIRSMKVQTSDFKELIAIGVGDLVIVRTSDEHFALVKITAAETKDAVVQMNFVYQTRPRSLRF